MGPISRTCFTLPHGYEGEGPEHSSARLERFLQLAAESNIQVAYYTHIKQLFHALRRQTLRSYRKPLIVMSPKSFLRNPLAGCSLTDLAHWEYQEILDDPHIKNPADVKK